MFELAILHIIFKYKQNEQRQEKNWNDVVATAFKKNYWIE